MKKKLLPWTTLPKILADHGWQLENWPSEIPLPGSGSQSCDDNKGVNGLNKRHLSLLYEAVTRKDHPLKFSRIAQDHMLASPSGSIDATDAAEMSAPGSNIRSDVIGVLPNGSRRRGSEDDTEGSRRGDKRPRIMGD